MAAGNERPALDGGAGRRPNSQRRSYADRNGDSRLLRGAEPPGAALANPARRRRVFLTWVTGGCQDREYERLG